MSSEIENWLMTSKYFSTQNFALFAVCHRLSVISISNYTSSRYTVQYYFRLGVGGYGGRVENGTYKSKSRPHMPLRSYTVLLSSFLSQTDKRLSANNTLTIVETICDSFA